MRLTQRIANASPASATSTWMRFSPATSWLTTATSARLGTTCWRGISWNWRGGWPSPLKKILICFPQPPPSVSTTRRYHCGLDCGAVLHGELHAAGLEDHPYARDKGHFGRHVQPDRFSFCLLVPVWCAAARMAFDRF